MSTADFYWAQMGTSPDPLGFAATASGPAVDDVIGPPAGVLDIFYDGTPMETSGVAAAQSAPTRGAGIVGFLKRGDVHAAGLALVGAWMVKKFLEEQ